MKGTKVGVKIPILSFTNRLYCIAMINGATNRIGDGECDGFCPPDLKDVGCGLD